MGEELNTFKKVAERWRDLFKSKIVERNTMSENWRRLENHIFPKLTNTPLSLINSRILVEIMQPVAKKGLSSVIEKTLRTVVAIMDYAENLGLIEYHNCHKAKKSFHIATAENNPTIPPDELPIFLRDVQNWVFSNKIYAPTYYINWLESINGSTPSRGCQR